MSVVSVVVLSSIAIFAHTESRGRARQTATDAMAMTRGTPAKAPAAKDSAGAKSKAKTPAKPKSAKMVRQRDPVGFMVKFFFVTFCVLGATRLLFGPFPLETRVLEKRARWIEERRAFVEAKREQEEALKRVAPLVFAAGEGDLEETQRLLRLGEDVAQRTAAGETALHTAGIRGNPEVVHALIQAGADVNARTNGGTYLKMTPLHWMTYGRHLSGMRLLLDAGADVNAMNTRGETAIDMAEGFGKGGKLEMEMLMEYGGKPARYLDTNAKPEDDEADEANEGVASSKKSSETETPSDVDRPDALRGAKLSGKNEPAKIPPKAAAQVEAAASARLQFDEEGDIDDEQRAKRERAQTLMRKFQEQAKELERLHAQAKASQPDEL